MQAVLSHSLATGSKDQGAGNPPAPEVGMSLDGLEATNASIVEKAQINLGDPDQADIPLGVSIHRSGAG